MSRYSKPLVTKELIEFLEGLFPDRIPPISTDLEGLRVLQGQQQVLNKLREIHESNFED